MSSSPEAKFHILQLVTKRQFRGAEVFAANLSEELIRKGHQITYAGLYSAPPSSTLNVDGATNIDFNGKRSFISIGLLIRLVRFLNENTIDILQANGSDTLKYALLARLFSKRKFPIVYRNISIVSTWIGNNIVRKIFYKFLFSRVDFVTSVGQESLHDFRRSLAFPAERSMVIRRGIPITVYDRGTARRDLLQDLNLTDPVWIVAHAGNYSIEKNHEFLLDIFLLLKDRAPSVKLVLLGHGERYNFIREQIVNRALQNTVFQLGFQSEIGRYLAASDVFILCSKVEGVPGVILEAAVQHTPSISSDVGGVKEVIDNNVTGIIMKNFDAARYSSALLDLLSNRQQRLEMATRAFDFVVENFNPEKNTSLFIQLYSKLISEKQSK